MQSSFQIKIATPCLTSDQVGRVCGLVCAEGLQLLDGMMGASCGLPGRDSTAQNILYAERTFEGELIDSTRLYGGLLALAYDEGIAVSLDRVSELPRRLICFDLDSTLIRTELLNELAVHAGIGAQMTRLTERTMQGELDFRSSFLRRVAMLKGLPLGLLEEMAAHLPFTPGAAVTIAELRQRGFRTAVVTGGFSLFARRVQQQLDIDYCYSTEVEIANGHLTGCCVGCVVDEWGKAAAVQEICRREGIDPRQAVVVGDGANDIPMLVLAGQGITFHAAPRLAVQAMSLDSLLPLIG